MGTAALPAVLRRPLILTFASSAKHSPTVERSHVRIDYDKRRCVHTTPSGSGSCQGIRPLDSKGRAQRDQRLAPWGYGPRLHTPTVSSCLIILVFVYQEGGAAPRREWTLWSVLKRSRNPGVQSPASLLTLLYVERWPFARRRVAFSLWRA